MASKNETATVTVTINGNQASDTMKSLRQDVNKLTAELGKLPIGTDAFNKKLDELKNKKQILDDVKKQIQNTSSAWEKMLTVAGGMGIYALATKGLGAISSGMAQIGEVAKTSDAATDKWEKTTTALKFAWDSVLRTIATGDWSNLISNMNLAIQSGKDYAEILDEIAERQASLDVNNANTRLEILDQRRIMKDKTLDETTRANAAMKVMELENSIMLKNKDIAELATKAELAKYAAQTGLGEATIEKYVIERNANNERVKSAERYLELLAEEKTYMNLTSQRGQANAQATAELSKIRTEIANTAPDIVMYAEQVVSKFGKAESGAIESLSKVMVAEKNATIEYKEGTERTYGLYTGFLKELKKGDDEEKKQVKERADYLLKVQKDLGDALVAMIESGKERELAAERLAYQRKLQEIIGNSEDENKLREALFLAHVRKMNDIKEEWDKKSTTISVNIGQLTSIDIPKKIEAVKIEDKAVNDQIMDDIDNRLQDEWDAEKMMLERTGQMTIEKRREILAQERDVLLAGVSGNTEAQLLIWEQYYQKLNALNQDHFDSVLQNFQIASSTGINLLGAYYNYQSTQDQIQLASYEKTVNKKRKILDNDLNKGIISQAYYDEQIAKLENDLNNERKRIAIENAKRDMVMSMISVGIQEAIAIAAAIRLAAESSKTPIDLIINIVAAVGTVVGTFLTAYSKLEAAKAIQYADGKYDVIGASDGRTYRDVPYTGPAKTGIYERPALIGERGGELVVDSSTTKNLQMNYPWVVDAINHARVPQYADGNYSQISPARASSSGGTSRSDAELLAAVNRLNFNLEGGIKAKILYSDLENAQDTVNTIRNESRK